MIRLKLRRMQWPKFADDLSDLECVPWVANCHRWWRFGLSCETGNCISRYLAAIFLCTWQLLFRPSKACKIHVWFVCFILYLLFDLCALGIFWQSKHGFAPALSKLHRSYCYSEAQSFRPAIFQQILDHVPSMAEGGKRFKSEHGGFLALHNR